MAKCYNSLFKFVFDFLTDKSNLSTFPKMPQQHMETDPKWGKVVEQII